MTDRNQAPRDGPDPSQEVRDALEQIRRIEKIRADCRAIERETEQIDRQLRRMLTVWAWSIPVLASAAIALFLLTAATALAIAVLLYTACLAAGFWFCRRVYDSTQRRPATDDLDEPRL